MVTLDWETERTDGVTLVRLYVTSEYRRRVRVENRLDGPVWPPRREGQPAAGWDGDAFEGVVTPGERLVAGYATPAQPTDPPAEVVADDPADAETAPGPVGAEAVQAGGTTGSPSERTTSAGVGSSSADSTVSGPVARPSPLSRLPSVPVPPPPSVAASRPSAFSGSKPAVPAGPGGASGSTGSSLTTSAGGSAGGADVA